MNERTTIQRKKTAEHMRSHQSPASLIASTIPAGGQQLDSATRAAMEPRFGHNFSQVRVYSNEQAAELAETLRADAYTVGNNIVFGVGQYQPGTSEGQALLAHELAHVVQQRAGPVSGKLIADGLLISEPGDVFEQTADQIAESVIQGRSVSQMSKTSAQSVTTSALTIQRQVVCDGNGACWEEDDNASSTEPNASYPEPNMSVVEPNVSSPTSVPMDMPPQSSATPVPQEQSRWKSLTDNPIWNPLTNNALSGATALAEQAWLGVETLPNFTRSLMQVGGYRGLELGLKAEDMLAAPATAMPGLLAPSKALGGMSKASSVLAPLGVVSNAKGIYDAFTKEGNFGLDRTGDVVADTAGLFSSAVGTTSLVGSGLTAAGATSSGAALSGAAAALGPAAAVAGAGAGGYALGRLMDEGVDWIGDKISGNEKADHSISGGIADVMTTADQGLTSLWADPSKPAYTQTLGWQLAEILPSWLQ